jgi:hypothetical protein
MVGPSADRAAHRPMVSIRRTQVKATQYRHDPDLRRLSRWPLVTISALEDWIDRAIRRNVSFGERAASAACSQGNAAAYALTSYHKAQQARELLAPFTGGFDTRDLKEAKELLEELAQACLTSAHHTRAADGYCLVAIRSAEGRAFCRRRRYSSRFSM